MEQLPYLDGFNMTVFLLQMIFEILKNHFIQM
jgi:hypothetical protein